MDIALYLAHMVVLKLCHSFRTVFNQIASFLSSLGRQNLVSQKY